MENKTTIIINNGTNERIDSQFVNLDILQDLYDKCAAKLIDNQMIKSQSELLNEDSFLSKDKPMQESVKNNIKIAEWAIEELKNKMDFLSSVYEDISGECINTDISEEKFDEVVSSYEKQYMETISQLYSLPSTIAKNDPKVDKENIKKLKENQKVLESNKRVLEGALAYFYEVRDTIN